MSRAHGKTCSACREFKSLGEYHVHRRMLDGRQPYCKACISERYQRLKTRNGSGNDSGANSEDERGSECADAGPESESLYVLTNPRIPGEFKVGRSRRVEQRRAEMQASQNFKIQIVAEFPGLGHAETSVHDCLAHLRAREGPGREWFRATLSEILVAIATAIDAARPAVNLRPAQGYPADGAREMDAQDTCTVSRGNPEQWEYHPDRTV